jgi:chromosomal replication initiation ATPase DnaA
MKQNIFNQYADRVVKLFNISKEDMFSKSKKSELVEARHLLYYICYNRQMKITSIQDYMALSGYIIRHSSIIHGIKAVENRIKDDEDYVVAIKDLEKSVSI